MQSPATDRLRKTSVAIEIGMALTNATTGTVIKTRNTVKNGIAAGIAVPRGRDFSSMSYP